MEFPQSNEFQNLSYAKNRNYKNENVGNNPKKIQFNDINKNKILITKAHKHIKIPIPILLQKNQNKNGKIKNKFIKLNNKDLLIRALSYKTIENDNNLEKHKTGVNKFIINKKNNDFNSLSNTQNKSIYNSFRILKENLTTDININDINEMKDTSKNQEKINFKKGIILNIDNNDNNINSNDNIKNIVTSLTSKNRVFKRNIIPNLKNINAFNKNTNKIHKNNYSNIKSSNNSTTKSNIKKNYIKEKLKIENKFNSNIIKNFPGILSQKEKDNMPVNKTITKYKTKNKQIINQNKVMNLTKTKKMRIFKNCRSQTFKNIDTIINTINGNDSSRSNYYKNNCTESSFNKNIINQIKPISKYNEKCINKNTIIKTKFYNQILQKNKTDREFINSGNIQLKNELVNNLINNNINKSNIFETSKLKDMKKIIFTNKLNNIKAKKLIKKEKILFLTSANSTLNSISNFKIKFNKKNISNVGSFTSRLKNVNINKINKTNFNNLENSERLSYKNLNDSSNVSFIKKLGNKINYLNINLNNWSNINNTTISNNNSNNNNQNITIPTHTNTINNNSTVFKKKLKNQYIKKQNDTLDNKSLINSNNNIIILNNISMNNLNNISFDYLSKINKNKANNSYKNFDILRKKLSSYVSKEKNINIEEKNREMEKKREYYNNQKRIHKRKHNCKKNNRIKEQNLNGFNLRQNNLMKSKKEIIKKPKFISHTKINSSINFNHINKPNAPFEYIHKHHNSNNFNMMINTNKINNNINIINKNYSTSINRPIFNLVKNLREKIKKEKSKINSEQRSSKKLKSMKILPLNTNNLNPLKQNKLKSKKNKKSIKDITDFNDINRAGKRIKKNCLSDVNEKLIDEIKISKYDINTIYKNEIKDKEYNKNSYKSFSIDDKKKNKKSKIKIIKKKKNKLLNIINNLNESIDKKDKYIKKTNTDIFNTHDISGINENDISKKINPQQAEEYTTDIIESLLEEENYYINKKKYINPFYLENEDSEITPEMRTIAVDWLVLIHYKIFKFSENTLFLAIQIFDRYLSKVDLNTEQTELLLYTSFMLASKHNEIDYVNMQETLKLSQDKFSKEQIIKMELEILIKLDFEILAPTMCEFFVLFASFLNLNKYKINHGLYILNIILVDFHMLKYPNFMLAFAVIKLITKKVDKNLEKLIENILKEKKFDKFSNMFNKDGYLKICNKIKLLYNTFLETKYKNIQDKFSDKEYNSVSKSTNI